MAHLQCTFYSKALEMDTLVHVVLPNEGDLSRTKVVYLLHGLSDNASAWSRFTMVERYALSAGVAVIMPEVQRSFYCDTASGMAYFSYIAQELPELCAHFFSLSRNPALNYIMGLSMGGYGALKCALTFPEQYAGCGSFSGALRMDDSVLRNVLKQAELEALVGSTGVAGEKNDLFSMVRKADSLPRLYLSCGEQDWLYKMNLDFVACLEEQGIFHRFDHRPGIHNWDFWDQSLQDCFRFLFEQQ